MNRRELLFATTVGVGVTSLAGCLGDDDASEPDAETLIESAGTSLATAADELAAAVDDAYDPAATDSHTIDTGPILDPLDDAADDLETARGTATDDQLDRIEALEGTIDVLRDLVEAYVALGDAFDEYDSGDRSLGSNQFEEAIAAFERAEDHVVDATDHLSVARSTLESIDRDVLDDLGHVDRSELADVIDELDDLFTAMEYLTVGMAELSAAMVPYEEAEMALDADRFEDAADAFAESSTLFETAHATFDEGREDAGLDHFEAGEATLADCEGEGIEF